MSLARLLGAPERPKQPELTSAPVSPTHQKPASPCQECSEEARARKLLLAVEQPPLVIDPGSGVAPPGRAMTLPSLPEEGQTACVITCHNYGRFLEQCLESVLNQTLPLDFVVVVDDASSDNTEEVCKKYAGRIKYLRGEWRDFTKARRAGLALLPRTKFLLFVDADNALSLNYHEALKALMADPKVAVAYTPKRNMEEDGALGSLWYDEFDYHTLRKGNVADACALIRTEAYDQAGGWRGFWGHGGLTDWMLWLRITRLGWKLELTKEAELFYRRHPAGMQAQRGHDTKADKEAKINVHKDAFVTTIVTLFSGRRWALDGYFASMRDLRWNRENLRLVAIDNSCDPEFGVILKKALAALDFPTIYHRDTTRVIQEMPAEELVDSASDRGKNVYMMSLHLGRLYAKARELMPAGTDLVFAWEDDIQPPPDALEQYALNLFRNHAHAISGCVRGRFTSHQLLAWEGEWDAAGLDYMHPAKMPPKDKVKVIQASGFMSTLMRREAWDALTFRPAAYWNNQYPYYDWAVGYELHRAGWKWVLDGSVHCGHCQKSGELLLP